MSIKDAIKKAAGKAWRSVKRLARRIVTKTRSTATRVYSVAVGATRFEWRSRRDERVRALHRELDGKSFDMNEGHPTEGLPGEPYNCRCTAIPIVEQRQRVVTETTVGPSLLDRLLRAVGIG